MFISFESPYGSLVVDYRGNGGAAVSSDILMRKANPEKYEETSSVQNGNAFLMFRNKESINYEKSAYLQFTGTTIGITLKSDSSLNYDVEFLELEDGCAPGNFYRKGLVAVVCGFGLENSFDLLVFSPAREPAEENNATPDKCNECAKWNEFIKTSD
jgi:hypothetical protein